MPLTLAERASARVAGRLSIIFAATELGAPMLISQFLSPDDLLWLTPVNPAQVEIVDDDGRRVGRCSPSDRPWRKAMGWTPPDGI